MKTSLISLILFLSFSVHSQELIDGLYDFQSGNVKDYTLYIPSTYVEGTPNDMMLGLHPWNTSRWNANSWCDTLKTFAEANGLLLVCPDGGADGKIDDPIDTAFTTFLIDEVRALYTINDDQIYAMGFSWGGKTVYTYGLQHADRFAGFMPIGAAVNSSEVSPHVNKAADKNFYIIHGSADSPNSRFTPIVNMLDGPHCVETNLLTGVGHTIDFPNRNQLLTDAFQYLKSNSCGVTSTSTEIKPNLTLQKNTYSPGEQISLDVESNQGSYTIYTLSGQVVDYKSADQLIAPQKSGLYIISNQRGGTARFVVR